MPEAIRRAISVLRQKQVLHRLGVAISVTVIGVACYVLYHMLRGINVDDVIEAIEETETHQIVLSAVFVAAGYFTLTFYDLFAVRAIGHSHIPYRINAFAAFTKGTDPYYGGLDIDAFAAYLEANSPYTPGALDRITGTH